MISGFAATPSVLWSPNHQMANVTLSYSVAATCEAQPMRLIAITSNQSTNGIGDGNTAIDWSVADSNHMQPRSERSADLGDRIYTITLTATDSAGSKNSGSVTVTVPHDSRQ